MFVRSLPLMILSALCWLAGPAWAGDRIRQDEVRQLRASGQILPMETILSRAQALQPGQLIEVEFERKDGRYVYELKIIDAQDRVHELYFDAHSGELIRRKLD